MVGVGMERQCGRGRRGQHVGPRGDSRAGRSPQTRPPTPLVEWLELDSTHRQSLVGCNPGPFYDDLFAKCGDLGSAPAPSTRRSFDRPTATLCLDGELKSCLSLSRLVLMVQWSHPVAPVCDTLTTQPKHVQLLPLTLQALPHALPGTTSVCAPSRDRRRCYMRRGQRAAELTPTGASTAADRPTAATQHHQ